MIDSENLRTASLYINNQLLSRGLLRDGRSIDFDRPGDNDHELADTMGRIMSVVNDLILRRDVRTLSLTNLGYQLPTANCQLPTDTKLPFSVTPNTANPSPPPSAPSAPTPSANQTTSPACKTATSRPSGRST